MSVTGREVDVINALAARQAGADGLAATPWGRPLISELLESIPDAVIGCDAAGEVVYWSRAAREAYGYSADEALGRPVTTLLQTRFPAPLMEIMEEVTDRGLWQGTLAHRTKDGREVAVESRWVARYDDAGKLVGGFGVERGLGSGPTALGEPQAAVVDDAPTADHDRPVVERTHGLKALAGGVVHDFNNALAIIINYAAFIADELGRLRTAPSEDQRQALMGDLGEISAAAERAASLTGQLLAFSRQPSSDPQPIDIGDCIREIEQLLRTVLGEHARLVLSLADALPTVRAQRAALQQAVVNLALNARDAIPDGGEVTIEVDRVTVDENADLLAMGTYVRLRVSDPGTGMTPEVAERAFEPFFTTKDGGAGLGLASVQWVVGRAGGHARLRSEPGLGTSFVALLPAADLGGEPGDGSDAGDRRRTATAPATAEEGPGAARRAAEPSPAAGSTTATATILVVEDEHPLLELCRRILAQAGYRVLTAGDGRQALELAEAHDGEIDLLLTDVVMPGMLGHHLAEKLRALRPTTAVAYMSGFSDAVLGPAAGRIRGALIDKPFTAPALLEHVRWALAAGEPPRP